MTGLIFFAYFSISALHSSLWFDSEVADIFRSVKLAPSAPAGPSWRGQGSDDGYWCHCSWLYLHPTLLALSLLPKVI